MLDLEGNNVEDLGQMRYLQLCPRLATLTLEGNLVCLKPDPGPSNKVWVLNTQSAYIWDGYPYPEWEPLGPHAPFSLFSLRAIPSVTGSLNSLTVWYIRHMRALLQQVNLLAPPQRPRMLQVHYPPQ